MKLILPLTVAFTFTSVVYARPQDATSPATILRNEYELEDDGGYHFLVVTSDGFRHSAVGQLRNGFLAVHGTYSYQGPDGKYYVVDYFADEKGYRIDKSKERGDLCIASLCGTGIG